ncbi:MAG: hypothetical protein EXQ81_11295 [Thermoleophilia bacterium]|nr:hypothetical protein [Thermoleophilia bacterium]
MPLTMRVAAPVPGLASPGARYCGSQRSPLAVHEASVEPQLHIAEACAEIEAVQALEVPEKVRDVSKQVHQRVGQGTTFGGASAVVRQPVGVVGVVGVVGATGDPRRGGHGIVVS